MPAVAGTVDETFFSMDLLVVFLVNIIYRLRRHDDMFMVPGI